MNQHYLAALEASTQREIAALELATTPEAKRNVYRRLRSVRQLLAETKAQQEQFNPPQLCGWVR